MGIKVHCDRCGKLIGETHPWAEAPYPYYLIQEEKGLYDKKYIDLCEQCYIIFKLWLNDRKNFEL